MPSKQSFDPQVLSTSIMSVVDETFKTMCNLSFTSEPKFGESEIIEYESRMRVFGLEKFNGPCYVTVINFFLDDKKLQQEDPCGTMVVYFEEDCASKILKALGYQIFNEDDEETVMDNCGEFCNVIAGNFKNELVNLGYKELVINAPLKYRNDIPEGVIFPYDETTV
ncbi:MAG: chemotaxis protein CheX, partial [Candidatus Omnitrophica bacterium]|nr:chemotaxis protein CheX [Candidatus Omnitrophota bacterium]